MARYQGYPTDAASRRTRYDALKKSLWSDRGSFESHWQEIASFMLPRRIRFQASDRNRGDKRNQNIINSTARYSIRTLASGLHAGLTSPARPWMKLTTPDPKLAAFGPVKAWLHEVTRRMLDLFLQSNLYNVLPIVYGDIGVFGTGAMAILEDSKELFRAYQYPIGSYALGLDARGLACSFVREYELTVRQVVEDFGVQTGYRDIDWTHISPTVKNLWENGQYESSVPCVWTVTPNEQADDSRVGSKYLPWSSCHYEAGSNQDGTKGFLRESGFRTFPILAPRWDVTGEDTYGTDCPGMTALGDVKQLQIEERNKGKAIAKMIDPPLVGPANLRTQKTSLLPGDVTYINEMDGTKGLHSIHEVNIDLNDLRMDIGEVQYRIQRAFYEDLFLMLARSDERGGLERPTAREVDERHEEKLLALGPVLERTNDELLDPLIDRVFGLMEAHGLVPDPPDELDGVRLKVEYVSILAQAQKLVGIVGQDRFFASVIPLAQADPGVLDKLDLLQGVDNYADMLGVDPRIVRSTEEAQQRAQQRAQAQQMAEAAQQADVMASATQKMGATPMNGDTALNRVLGGGGAASAAFGGPA